MRRRRLLSSELPGTCGLLSEGARGDALQAALAWPPVGAVILSLSKHAIGRHMAPDSLGASKAREGPLRQAQYVDGAIP